MKTSSAAAHGWRCPECGDATSRDEAQQGYVRHLANRACQFEKGQRDRSTEVAQKVGSGVQMSAKPRSLQGKDTDLLGQWITQYVAQATARRGYKVFYDHGDSKQANVAAIKAFYGTNVSHRTRIADVDVMIVGPDGKVDLLIEVEERNCSPKKILGDVLAITMCNRFAVRIAGQQNTFEIDSRTSLIVSGILPEGGNRIAKVADLLLPRFRQMDGFADGISPKNVDLVFTDSIEKTISALRERISARLPT